MAKRLLKINSLKEIKHSFGVDGYILGIDKFSCLFENTFSLHDIRQIVNDNKDKEIFVSFNRMIYNSELKEYKKTLYEIDKIGVNGIIVSDIAALTYDLKTNVILDQFHLNNNYYTVNHYFNNGLNGVVLTNDITNDEIKEIRKNTSLLLFKQVLGFSHLSTSARKLVTNYLKHFNIKNFKTNKFEIKEDKSNDYFKVIEDDIGTHILDGKVLDLMDFNLCVDYEIIDGFLIEQQTFFKVLDNIEDNKKIKSILNNKYEVSEGFINKKTIYKVRKDEK